MNNIQELSNQIIEVQNKLNSQLDDKHKVISQSNENALKFKEEIDKL